MADSQRLHCRGFDCPRADFVGPARHRSGWRFDLATPPGQGRCLSSLELTTTATLARSPRFFVGHNRLIQCAHQYPAANPAAAIAAPVNSMTTSPRDGQGERKARNTGPRAARASALAGSVSSTSKYACTAGASWPSRRRPSALSSNVRMSEVKSLSRDKSARQRGQVAAGDSRVSEHAGQFMAKASRPDSKADRRAQS
jgi:hypothetical protein